MSTRMQPGRMARRILEWTLPFEDRTSLSDELTEVYAARASQQGRRRADAWYMRQVMGFVMRLGWERVRDVFGTFDTWRGDVRHAARTFVRQPGYAAAFVLVLALGAGGVVALYAVAEQLLLRPVPAVAAPDELVTLRLVSSDAPPHVFFPISDPDLAAMREVMTMTRGIAGTNSFDVHVLAGSARPERLSAEIVTSNYFDVLGVRLAAGRAFGDASDAGDAGDGVILSDALARRLWPDAEPSQAVGRSVRVNGRAYDVAGIAPRRFHGADLSSRADLWFTLASLPLLDASVPPTIAQSRGMGVWSRLYARRAPGATVDVVHAGADLAMRNVQHALRGQWHSFMATHFRFEATPGVGIDPGVRPTVQRTLLLLAGAALLLLLLSTANLANLALTRATSRFSVTAVRLALGASRARVARELFIETLLLCTAGGVAAFAISMLWTGAFRNTRLSEYGAALDTLEVSPRVIVVALLCALCAAALAGMQPALLAGKSALERTLRRMRSSDRDSQHLRSALVGTQVAISMTLLLGAGLLARSVVNLRSIDVGFDPAGMVTFAMDPAMDGQDQAQASAVATRLEQQLAQSPGVQAAGWISPPALRSGYVTESLAMASGESTQAVVGAGFFVTPGFLRALGVRTLAGTKEWNTEARTVVVTLNVASELFPGEPLPQLIGRTVYARGTAVRIAAIIDDVNLADIRRDPPPVIFRPFAERHEGLALTAFVRAPRLGITDVRGMLEASAAGTPWFDLRTARTAIDTQFSEQMVMARVAGLLGLLGLLIAAIGLYAVLSYAVLVQRRDIGIRVALGAGRSEICRQYMQRGLVLALAGAIVGAAGGLGVSRMLQSRLFGIAALDTATYIGAMLTVIGVAIVTTLLPSLQAARVAPADVLREDG